MGWGLEEKGEEEAEEEEEEGTKQSLQPSTVRETVGVNLEMGI